MIGICTPIRGISLCLVLFSFFTTIVYGQVTIGSASAPRQGALLDLTMDGGSTDKGLLMSRVLLFDVTRLTPMLTEEESEKDAQRKIHTGLMVYNLTDAPQRGLCPGLYVWDGDNWVALNKDPILDRIIIPLQDVEGNQYTAGWFGACNGQGTYVTLQNSRSTKYADNTSITEKQNGTSLNGKYFYYPNINKNILNTHPEYGLLYNWNAVVNSNDLKTDVDNRNNQNQEVIQGICPDGWHVLSDREWSDLEREIIGHPYKYAEASHSDAVEWKDEWYGGILDNLFQRRGDVRFYFTKTKVNGISTQGRSMENGMNILPVGRVLSGNAEYFGTNSYFWTSSSNIKESGNQWYRAWSRNLEIYGTDGHKDWLVWQRDHHTYDYCSVRCKINN